MKIKALILLLHFLIYFSSGFAVANCSRPSPVKTACCKRMCAKHQEPLKCPGRSQNKTDNCYNCPLLYIATLTPAVTVSAQSVLVEKEFGLLQYGKPGRFPSSIWKPPNVA